MGLPEIKDQPVRGKKEMKDKRAILLHGLSGNFAVVLKEKKIIGDKKISNRLSLYKVLHECGHLMIFNSPVDDCSDYSFDQICEEIMAWKYAKSCVKPEYWGELEELAIVCIMSYVKYCVCPQFFKVNLLSFMLQWGDDGEKAKQCCDPSHLLFLWLLEKLPSYYWKIIQRVRIITQLIKIIGLCVRELVVNSFNSRYSHQSSL